MIPFFEHAWMLVLAPLFGAAVALLLLGAARRRARRLRRLASEPVMARLVPPATLRSTWLRALLLGLAALCASVAFAGPRWGTEREVQRASGIDMVLAMDASLSMLATDERPSRLQRMKEEARRLLAMSVGDRIGLIAFAGRSYILTPLTVDQGAIELYLDNLDPSVVGQAGTSLARTIRQGTELLLSTRTGSDRALVVMSDGEAFEPRDEVVAAARYAAQSGVKLVTVGFGTTAGSTIPMSTPQGGTTLKHDQEGKVVVTHYTPEMLQAAADAAGGTFIDAAATDKATRVRGALATLRRQSRSAQAGRELYPRFQLFLIPALFLVLVDTLLAERRGRRKPAPAVATTAAGAALLFALLVPRAAHASGGEDGDRLYREARYKEAAAAYERAIREGDDSPRLRYNLGTALLAAGRTEEAAAALERSAQDARDPELRYRALFNLGLLHLERGRATKGESAAQDYSAAVEAYKRALRLRPDELHAKWNYELANRQKKRSGGGGGGGGGGGAPQQNPAPANAPQPSAQPTGALDRRQAEEILNSAAREERDVQAKKQNQNTPPPPPPGGKDW